MTFPRLVCWTLLASIAFAHTPTSVEDAGGEARPHRLIALGRARADAPPADAATPSPAELARRAQVVAKGSGVSVTLGDLEDYLNKMPPALRARYLAPEERRTLVTNFVRNELFALEAEQRGFANNPAVRQTVKDGAVQSLVRTEVDEKTTPQSISQEQIAAYYAANPSEFHHPAERRASHILVATREQAQALLAEAKAADARGFGDLARRHSLDGETKLRGGDLAFFAREPAPTEGRKVHQALRKAVFGLKAIGDTAQEPVEVEGQYSIVRLTGERPERNVSLSEAENTIRSRLWRDARQKAISDLLEKLRAKDKPRVFPERVDLVSFDDMEKRPAGFAPDPPGPTSPRAGSPSAPAAGSKAP